MNLKKLKIGVSVVVGYNLKDSIKEELEEAKQFQPGAEAFEAGKEKTTNKLAHCLYNYHLSMADHYKAMDESLSSVGRTKNSALQKASDSLEIADGMLREASKSEGWKAVPSYYKSRQSA